MSENRRIEVRARMAGIFYRKPAPDQPPYVEVGDKVKKGQVLALLETMKVFQPVKCPVEGKVVAVVAEEERSVRENDMLFIIEVA